MPPMKGATNENMSLQAQGKRAAVFVWIDVEVVHVEEDGQVCAFSIMWLGVFPVAREKVYNESNV